MGTECQYAISPLAANPKNMSFSVGGLDDWEYFKKQKGDRQKTTVFINFEEDSMDKLLDQEKIETIRRTLLTHESIFRQQVKELHRLYNMQKILMKETKTDIKLKDSTPIMRRLHKGSVSREKVQDIPQSSHIAEVSAPGGSGFSATMIAFDEDDYRLKQRSHKPSLHISMEDNYNTCRTDGMEYEECDVDLTLCIGGKKMYNSEGSSSSSNRQSSSPHWLYQGKALIRPDKNSC